MKTDSIAPIDAADTDAEQSAHPADPFAVDLFASHHSLADASALTSGANEADAAEASHVSALSSTSRNTLPWQARLPRVSAAQANLSSSLSTFVPDFSAQMCEAVKSVLAHYTRVELIESALALIDVREREFDATNLFTEAPCVWAALSIAPDEARIFVALEAGFAAGLIDYMLGGDGAMPDSLRTLSLTEQAVIEFLWLCLIREVNARLGETLWRLDAVTARPPVWLASGQDRNNAVDATVAEESLPEKMGAATQRGLIATVRLQLGGIDGLARLFLTPEALMSLRAAPHLLLRGSADAQHEKLEQYKCITEDVALHVMLGETEVTVAALVELEPGDVVIVARPLIAPPHGNTFTGQLAVRLADERTASVVGVAARNGELQGGAMEDTNRAHAADTLNLIVETIKKGGKMPVATERVKMPEETANEEAQESSGVALNEIWLTLRVELAGRRISLDELAQLRVGQLLELGCLATDPVELVAEDRRVARGELIDIEGQLGVRITQLAS